MAYDYDALYKTTPEALGAPTQQIVEVFKGLKPPLRVLDVGCGQGRDALFLAGLGHSVVGVDMSTHGIRDLVAQANQLNLPIEGVVADILSFEPDGEFDVLLIDRTLHMLGEVDRVAVLARLLNFVSKPGWLVIADEKRNLPAFCTVLENSHEHWTIKRQHRGFLIAHLSA